MGSGAADLELQYRGGWTIQHTTGPDDWNRVAVRGDSRIEQGGRTYGQLLAGLDRIDGRPVLGDFIAGLQAGLSQEEASKPLPFGPDGEPLPAGAAPEPDYSTGRLPPWAYRSANRAANNYIDARNEANDLIRKKEPRAATARVKALESFKDYQATMNDLAEEHGQEAVDKWAWGTTHGEELKEGPTHLDSLPSPAAADAPEPDPVEEGDPETLISGPMGIGMVALYDVWWVRHMREDLNDPDDIRSRQNELARVELLHYLDSRNPDPKSFWGSSSQIPPKARATWSGLWSLHDRAKLQDLEVIKGKLEPFQAVYDWFQKVFQDGAEKYAKEAGEKGMAEALRLTGNVVGATALPPPAAPPAAECSLPLPGRAIQRSLFDEAF